jgi:hypothetical protein
VVLSGSLLGVDRSGWDQGGIAVGGEDHVPALAVDLVVVEVAEQRPVVQIGRAAVGPGHDAVVPVAGTVSRSQPTVTEPGSGHHEATHRVSTRGTNHSTTTEHV